MEACASTLRVVVGWTKKMRRMGRTHLRELIGGPVSIGAAAVHPGAEMRLSEILAEVRAP